MKVALYCVWSRKWFTSYLKHIQSVMPLSQLEWGKMVRKKVQYQYFASAFVHTSWMPESNTFQLSVKWSISSYIVANGSPWIGPSGRRRGIISFTLYHNAVEIGYNCALFVHTSWYVISRRADVIHYIRAPFGLKCAFLTDILLNSVPLYTISTVFHYDICLVQDTFWMLLA